MKEAIIAQGIELQRQWIREVKVKVEEERGGRLARLDELATGLKRLERIALDNSSYLDENIRIHGMWTALRALQAAIEAPERKPFREELRILRHIAVAKVDEVVSAALASLEQSDIPDVGVEPLADLTTWFATSVAPRVSSVALVPDENSGVLSFLASHFLSSFRFQRHGLTPGSDVLSVLSRAEYYMNEKELDSAARELNQLTGPAKELLHDWLEAARRRLEAQQALEVSLPDSNSQWVSLTVLRSYKRRQPLRLCSSFRSMDGTDTQMQSRWFTRTFHSSLLLQVIPDMIVYRRGGEPHVICAFHVHQSQMLICPSALQCDTKRQLSLFCHIHSRDTFERTRVVGIIECPIRMQPEGCQLLPSVKPLLTLDLAQDLAGRLSARVKNSTAKLSCGKGISDFTEGTWCGSGVSADTIAVPLEEDG